MAMEKPKAIITSNARIFLLEIFLTALLMIPVNYTFHIYCTKAIKKRIEGVFYLGSCWAYGLIFHFLFSS